MNVLMQDIRPAPRSSKTIALSRPIGSLHDDYMRREHPIAMKPAVRDSNVDSLEHSDKPDHIQPRRPKHWFSGWAPQVYTATRGLRTNWHAPVFTNVRWILPSLAVAGVVIFVGMNVLMPNGPFKLFSKQHDSNARSVSEQSSVSEAASASDTGSEVRSGSTAVTPATSITTTPSSKGTSPASSTSTANTVPGGMGASASTVDAVTQAVTQPADQLQPAQPSSTNGSVLQSGSTQTTPVTPPVQLPVVPSVPIVLPPSIL